MFHKIKRNNKENVSIDTKKYSKIISEIEKYVKAKEEKPIKFKGIVKYVDLSNNILTINLQTIKLPNLSKGYSISIKEDKPLSNDIKVIAKEFYKSTLKVEIKTNILQFENKKITITARIENTISKRLSYIADSIKNGKIDLDGARILDFIIGEGKPQQLQEKVSFISNELNENQKDAVVNSIKAKDFHLIIGPPGTGKTYVIEELIGQFTKRNQRILITAWTNLAVDNIIKRVVKQDIKNIIRIGQIDAIDSEIKKFSIFEKMKEYEEWKLIKSYRKKIGELFELINEIKKEKNTVQNKIDKIIDEKKGVINILDYLRDEKGTYEMAVPIPIKNKNSDNVATISSMNNKMISINEKSEFYLSLSKSILEMNNLQLKIPEEEYIKNLKKLTKEMRFSIFFKKIYSFLSHKWRVELKDLKQEYKNDMDYLDEIFKLQTKCNDLKISNGIRFNNIYSDGHGFPDKDALDFEFKHCKMAEDEYPLILEQELSNIMAKKMLKINQEVHRICMDYIYVQIDLQKEKIQSLTVEQDIQKNHKDNLHEKYKNYLTSLNFYKRNVENLEKSITSDIIGKSNLIAATAISSTHLFLNNINFDVVIMDETSQVASFMSLLPLLKCKKFILVGDDKQLQPIEEKEISKEMNVSIFNRFLRMYPEASTFLSIQYRMHKSISRITNEIFYEGKLITAESVAERMLSLKKDEHQFLNSKMPIVFIDTLKIEYYEDETDSGCSNTKEAKYVTDIIDFFVKNDINIEDIGVVTPYVKQKHSIEKHLNDIEINGIEVDTVHKFQGKEKDVIIMSFAKSRKYSFHASILKFIEDKTLINVSITRAKKKLILVGNSKTLCQSKLIESVICAIGKENTIIL